MVINCLSLRLASIRIFLLIVCFIANDNETMLSQGENSKEIFKYL